MRLLAVLCFVLQPWCATTDQRRAITATVQAMLQASPRLCAVSAEEWNRGGRSLTNMVVVEGSLPRQRDTSRTPRPG